MNLNERIMLKCLALVLCENVLFRFIIICLLIKDIIVFKNKEKKNIKSIIIGAFIIVFNNIVNINLTFENFLFLGIFSSMKKIKIYSIINIYLVGIVLSGVCVFCLKL